MPARVVVIGLASDYGCQVQMTNMEDHLLDVLGTIDLSYWQLASSGRMPDEYDVAIVEGAVTTRDHVELLRKVRATAGGIIAIGACATGGGLPALVTHGDLEGHADRVYGERSSDVACGRISPMPVSAVIQVDYHVPGCPIDPAEFVTVMQRALRGMANRPPREPLCAACKIAENTCMYEAGIVCLGLVTRTGCGAKCVSLGRPCTGCRGVAKDANMAAARLIVAEHGVDPEAFESVLDLYNSASEDR